MYDSIQDISDILKKYKSKKILLVTGRKSFDTQASKKFINEILSSYEVKRFYDFEVNPKYDDLIRGIEIKTGFKPDTILAIGGGSVIDMAKLLTLFNDQSDIDSYLMFGKEKQNNKISSLIVAPTTSGSGSEATHFAVLYKNSKKYSVASINIVPKEVILDYTLTSGNSREQTLYSALDAICQAFESLWSVQATSESKQSAIEAIKILAPIFIDFDNYELDENRKSLQIGSFYAGKAINISKTNAPHALSYHLTDKYGVPHGLAVFLIHKRIGEELYLQLDNVYKSIVESIFKKLGLASYAMFLGYLSNLINENTSIAEIIVSTEAREEHINSVNLERLKNSPIVYTKEILLEKIY